MGRAHSELLNVMMIPELMQRVLVVSLWQKPLRRTANEGVRAALAVETDCRGSKTWNCDGENSVSETR